MLYITFTPETVSSDDHGDFAELFTLLELQCSVDTAMSELRPDRLNVPFDVVLTASIEHALNACPAVVSWEVVEKYSLQQLNSRNAL